MTIDYTLDWSDENLKPPITLHEKEENTTDTALTLTGYGDIPWGYPLQENLIHILESFASPIPPRNPTTGHLWFDTQIRRLKLWDGTKWVLVDDDPFCTNVHISPPQITSPDHNSSDVSISPTLHSSSFIVTGGGDAHHSTDWEVKLSNNSSGILVSSSYGDIDNKLTFPVVGLDGATTYYARVRYRGVLHGFSPWSDYSTFTTADVSTIEAPVVVGYNNSPSNTNVAVVPSLTIQFSDFTVSGDGTDQHQSSDWEICEGYNGSGRLFASSIGDVINLTTISIPGLRNKSPYSVRMRYAGVSLGQSFWSDWSNFTTIDSAYISPPIISVNGTTNVSLTPTLSGTSFLVLNSPPYDAHESSYWEIRTASNGFGDIVWHADATTGENKNIIQAVGLSYSTTYYARVKYKGVNLGFSNWSTDFSFTTVGTTPVASIDQPVITDPVNGSVNVALSPTIYATSFSVSVGSLDTYESTDWELRLAPTSTGVIVFSSYEDSVNVSSIPLPTPLTFSSTYYARVRYKGTSQEYSAWSDFISFTTIISGGGGLPNIGRPYIISPSFGSTGVDLTPHITSSPFTTNNGIIDSHLFSDWEIRDQPIDWSPPDTAYLDFLGKTFYDVPNSKAMWPGFTYYVRVRYYAAINGYSEWSDYSKFTAEVGPHMILTQTRDTITTENRDVFSSQINHITLHKIGFPVPVEADTETFIVQGERNLLWTTFNPIDEYTVQPVNNSFNVPNGIFGGWTAGFPSSCSKYPNYLVPPLSGTVENIAPGETKEHWYWIWIPSSLSAELLGYDGTAKTQYRINSNNIDSLYNHPYGAVVSNILNTEYSIVDAVTPDWFLQFTSYEFYPVLGFPNPQFPILPQYVFNYWYTRGANNVIPIYDDGRFNVFSSPPTDPRVFRIQAYIHRRRGFDPLEQGTFSVGMSTWSVAVFDSNNVDYIPPPPASTMPIIDFGAPTPNWPTVIIDPFVNLNDNPKYVVHWNVTIPAGVQEGMYRWEGNCTMAGTTLPVCLYIMYYPSSNRGFALVDSDAFKDSNGYTLNSSGNNYPLDRVTVSTDTLLDVQYQSDRPY